jgi:uncharacterized delta-60 repeat protein
MRKRVASAAFIVCVIVCASVLALDLSRESTWGGPADEAADEVAIAPDGSVYVTGSTLSFGAGDSDAFLLKYSAAGLLEWQRTYGLAVAPPLFRPADFGRGVAAAADGSAYITGQLSDGNLFVVAFDINGNLLWQQTWGDPGHFATTIEVGPDGSIYVAGGTFTFGAGGGDALLLKFSADGTLLWSRTWGGGLRESLADMAVSADGSIYIVGETSSFFWNDAFIVKFAPDGSLLWDREWGTMDDATPNSSAAWGVGTADDGSVYITGSTTTASGSVMIVKLDAEGSLVWERVAGRAFGLGSDVEVAADGSVYATGYANGAAAHADAFVIKLLPNGKAREAATWGGTKSEAGHSIAIAPDGTIVVAGEAGAPPYVSGRVAPRMTTPHGFLLPTAGTVTSPAGTVRIPLGIVTAPNGSTTFGGGTDAMLLRLQP